MGFSQAPGLPYSKLGIPEDGDTASRAISKGKYVIWKGKNYFAKTDILQGETFVEDTNLTEIPDGALNGIADALNVSLVPQTIYSDITASHAYVAKKIGYLIYISLGTVSDGTLPTNTTLFTLAAEYRPEVIQRSPISRYTDCTIIVHPDGRVYVDANDTSSIMYNGGFIMYIP